MKRQRDSILVVDDDSEVLEALKNELDEYFEVTPMLGGEQALAILQGQSFSAIISDVRMPGIDGLTLVRECAKRYPDMVRVILTAFDDEDVNEMALSETGAYKLIKPWGDDLIITLQNALKQRQSKMDLQKSVDLSSAVFDLDSRLHLNLKSDQVLPAIISELLRVPEVVCISVYTFGEKGNAEKPIIFGNCEEGTPKLTQKRPSSPEQEGKWYKYTVSIGSWPSPYAACVCRLSKPNKVSIQYLDYVGRQGYRTMLLAQMRENNIASNLENNSRPSKLPQIPGYSTPQEWIIKELSVPSTVIVSAAEIIRRLSQQQSCGEMALELEEIALDLDSVFTTMSSLIENIKEIE